MKKSTNKFLFILYFSFIIIGGVYLGKVSINNSAQNQVNNQTKASESPTQTSSNNIEQNTQKNTQKGTLFYLVSGTDENVIYSFDIASKTKKIIFTDKNDQLKLKQVGNFAQQTKEIIGILAEKKQEFIGNLVLISTNGKGETKDLIREFSSPQSAIISSTTDLISYTIFSNVEPDYGFGLYLAKKDGTNSQRIDFDATNISNLSFCSQQEELVYQKSDELIISNRDGTSKKTAWKIPQGQNLFSLSCSKKSMIAISLGKNENQISEIDTMNSNGSIIKKISSDTLKKSIVFSQDEENIAYLSFLGRQNSTNGEIHLVQLDNLEETNLQINADKIIAWSM